MADNGTPASDRRPRILIADGDASFSTRTAAILATDYVVFSTNTWTDILGSVGNDRPDLILCDDQLKTPDGQFLWRLIRTEAALDHIPLVLVLDREPGERPAGPYEDVLYRPFAAAELTARVAFTLQSARLRREAVSLKSETEAMMHRINTVLTHLPFGLTMANPDGEIVYANPARERLLKYEGQPQIGDKLKPRLPASRGDGTPLEPDEYPIRRALKGEFVSDLEIRYDIGGGRPRWLRASGIPVHRPDGGVQYAIGVAIDITSEVQARTELLRLTESLQERIQTEIGERLKADEALRQVQKMQTIGQLTGGIAHDFNNLLQVMLGNLEALERQLHNTDGLDRDRMTRHVASAMGSVERATQMTQQLLAFSRRQPLSPSTFDANQLVMRVSELFCRTLGESIVVETRVAPALRPTYADQNQLEAALLNLAVNARDAMPTGGKLTIETATVSLDSTDASSWDEFVPGSYVTIAVTDTGSGIPDDIMPRIFEPFFTTKELGRGTGLGLSQVYGFVKQSGGHIDVDSEVGVGTTVTLYLPVGAAAAEADRRNGPPRHVLTVRGETVLVVEDDRDVREFSTEALRDLGYAVVWAENGTEALRQLESDPAIRLMFTDVGLPGGMTGRALADRARERWPNLKVLFTTGYDRNAIVHNGRVDRGVELINKPFTAAALAIRIRTMLDTA